METKNFENHEPSLQGKEASMDTESFRFTQAVTNYYLGKFNDAFADLDRVSQVAWQHQDYNRYTECLVYIIRILLEKERTDELLQVVLKIQAVIEMKSLSPEILSKALYSLGVINVSFPNGLEAAQRHFEKAIAVSIAAKDYRGLAYAIYGVAGVYNESGLKKRSLAELEKLDQILHHHRVADIKAASLLLRGFIMRDEGEPLSAVPFLQAACEQLKYQPNIYLFLQSLYGFGSVYMKAKDYTTAQVHLELARSLCSPEEHPRIHKVILSTLHLCRQELSLRRNNSIVFNCESGTVERLGMGTISLNSQFLLRDLLTLFLENPGKVFSKEELVQRIWKDEYSPLDHDNKIYVTLKRLRQVLEPLFPEMDTILRSRDGYTFNQQLIARIIKGEK